MASLTPDRPLANHHCPLCGGANQCAAAQAGHFDGPCWCQAATFTADLLARVPPALQGQACICAACAQAASIAVAAPTSTDAT